MGYIIGCATCISRRQCKTMSGADDHSKELLRAIADMLGMPPERFYDAAPVADPEDTRQLTYLWHRLRTPAGRAAALGALKKILDDEGG